MEHTAQQTETVIRQYADTVYRLAWAYAQSTADAEDIFQEVFLRYVRFTPQFESEEHRKAWLLRVTVNCAKTHLRKKRFRPTPQEEVSTPFTAPETLELHEALKKLPAKYRAVIHLFYFEDYPVEKISEVLKRRPSTVRTQLTRARNLLAQILEST